MKDAEGRQNRRQRLRVKWEDGTFFAGAVTGGGVVLACGCVVFGVKIALGAESQPLLAVGNAVLLFALLGCAKGIWWS